VGFLCGVAFGGGIALLVWHGWPGAAQLESRERVAVVHAVRLGEGIGDPRLAPSVIEYSSIQRRYTEQNRRQQWVVLLLIGGNAIFAIRNTINGSTRHALGSWFLVALLTVQMVFFPRVQTRRELNADRAERLAREALESPQD
jgi:hypothetical protein